MNEPKITPLARRLAEENSIDWRQLQGTGPEGTVVERDILGFLAKVMAGEVTLPPAPEEVPQAGPGAVANLAQAQAALQREGVQLGDLMPTAPASNPAEDSLLDDLDFDIDLDLDEPSLAPEDMYPAAAPVLEPPPMPDAPAANLDWDAQPAPSSLPSLPDLDPPAPPAPPAPSLIWETQEVISPLPSFEPPAPPAMPEAPRIAEPELPSLELEVPKAAEPELPSLELEPPVAPAAPEASIAEEPIFSSFDLDDEPEPLAVVEAEPEPPVVAEPEPLAPPVAPPAANTGIVGASDAATAAPESPAQQPSVDKADAPLPYPSGLGSKMTRVQGWQRTVEVRAAQEAANTLSEAWRMNVGLYPLLYRAVDRALADTQTPLRATKGVLQGEELHSARVSASQSLRGVLDSLQMASDPADGLAVLSLADTALDGVIFPGLPTVILGRVKDDYATLSLSADLDARHAGALLERISYYLERPILLV